MSEQCEEIKQMLEETGFIKNLDRELQDKLVTYMKVEDFKAGDVVFNERDKGDKIYLVDAGQIAIKKSIDWAQGRELIIDFCDPGDFFGEMAIIENLTRSARAEATEDSRLLVIDGEIFLELMRDNPAEFTKLLFSMIRILSNRLRNTHMKLITIYEIGNVLSGEIPMTEMASRILDTMLISMELKDGALLIFNPFSGLLEFGALRGVSPIHPEMRGIALSGVLRQIMEKGQCTEIDGTFVDENLRSLLGLNSQVSWLLIAPMKEEQQPIGFVILMKKDDYTPFNKGQILLMSAIAKQIALEVMTSRTREENTARQKFRRVYFKDVI